MIANLLQKVLVPTAVGTVVGFGVIFGAANSAAALTVESESYNNQGNQQDISHIVLYMKDNSGDITKVKIDSVSGIKSYDATNFLKAEYPDSEVVAYQVKASTFKSLNFLSNEYSKEDLPNVDKNKADVTFQYSAVSNLSNLTPTPEQTNNNTANNSESSLNTQPGTPTYVVAQESSTNKVKVPEPGSIVAIAIFGISGLIAKKQYSSVKAQNLVN